MRTAHAVVFVALAHCSSQPVGCPAIAYSALSVVVTSARTGARICDATVTARDGTFSEALRAVGVPDDCRYTGPYERPGTYTIDVESRGFLPTTSTPTIVRKTTGDCPHVEQVTVNIALERS